MPDFNFSLERAKAKKDGKSVKRIAFGRTICEEVFSELKNIGFTVTDEIEHIRSTGWPDSHWYRMVHSDGRIAHIFNEFSGKVPAIFMIYLIKARRKPNDHH